MYSSADSFLSSLSKMLKDQQDTKTIRITLKRDFHSFKPKPYMKRKLRKELVDKLNADFAINQQQTFDLIAKAKLDQNNLEDKKQTTKPSNPNQFTNSMINIFRLNFFQDNNNSKQIKKQKLPSQPDKNSKRTALKLKRNKINKERRKIRKQIKKDLKKQKQQKKVQQEKQLKQQKNQEQQQ